MAYFLGRMHCYMVYFLGRNMLQTHKNKIKEGYDVKNSKYFKEEWRV